MAEYIGREDLLELYRMDDPVLNKNGHVPLPVIRQNIMDIPAADVAPVVRCKDCKYSYADLEGLCCTYGPPIDCIVPGDYGCVYGERRASDG